jgi:chromosome segregation protein
VRIREIELVGFKSFREPARLVLSPGINAVVGPNGCGKSNVADAIRWALGEQSVKHLRARDMEDVIFCGNANSEPLNFAEVSLTFEQGADGGLDLAGEVEGLAAHVARLHEFTITRRIFRSGESQYLVNQSPARLRDITELFLGSGVGPKAYAMIEQGRVGQIVNAKPEELRLFIEEAAGTTRFRSRKLAAERKLERTNDNLLRVQDVMREIDRQLATLRRQARRAEEYRQLERDLALTEAALAGCRWRGLTAEQGRSGEDLQAARRVAAEVRSEVLDAERGRGAAAEREQAAAAEIESAFSAVAEVSAAVVRATERQTAMREGAVARDARIASVAEEIASLETGMRDAEATLEAGRGRRGEWLEREKIEAEALDASDREVERIVPLFERSQAEQGVATIALEEGRRRSASIAADRAKNAERLAGLHEERERIQGRLSDRRREVVGVAARLEQAIAARSAAQGAHERLAESRQGATRDLRLREEEQRRLEEGVSAIREVLVHRRGRLDGLREREVAFDGYAEGLAAAMELDPRPRGLVLDGLGIPPDLEPAAAAVLGEALRGAVVATPEDAVAIADHLRRTGAGRVALVPAEPRTASNGGARAPKEGTLEARISAAPGSERLRAALFEGVVLVDDLLSGVAAWRRGDAGLAWVTAAGDVVDRHGVVTGGRAPESADLLERRRELGELAAQIAEDELRQGTAERRLADVRDECKGLGEDLERLDGEAHAATLDLVAAEHGVETARRDLAAAERRAEETRSELDACERSITLAVTALAASEEEARGAAEAEGMARERLVRVEADLERQRVELDRARARREERRDTLSAAREALAHVIAEVGRIEHERAIADLRREALAVEIASLQREQEEATTTLLALDEELTVRREELRCSEGAVETAREEGRRAQAESREHEGRLVRSRALLEEARAQCQSIEVRLAELGAQIDALVGFTRERLEIEPSAAEIPEGFDEATATVSIQEIKDRIARLGDVNVAAIADARDLEERHGFLEAQRKDLEASIEDLRRTIAELSRTTRTRFRDTFERANLKFQEFFAELFRGGRAALKLTNSQNLLDTGVEMEVQPPGKSLRSLESLSGGEKALTAISLLMALFSLRATPFCVLDEVDAPLDEANLGRFNAMVQRMSGRSQFIVITHHQQTMESAHVLYGVTMAEAGVSQLVSVELSGRDEERADDTDGLAMVATA